MQHTREDRVVAGAGDAAAIPHITQMQDLALFSRDDAERITRAHVQCAYLGDRVALTRMLSSVKFFVDTSDLGFGSHVLLDGYWEMWLTLFCLRNVTPGMVAVDVGANFGYYTLLFANNVGATGHVIAVEPNSRAAALLRRSVELNGFSSRTLVEETACAEQNGLRFRLVVPADEPKNAHIVELSAQADGADRDLVVSRTLESLCAGLDRLDFIKIDAEGAEERIAIGMGDIVRRYRPMIVMEVNVRRYPDAPGFIDALHRIYGRLYHVDFNGFAVAVTPETLLSTRVGEDWLVVISPQQPK